VRVFLFGSAENFLGYTPKSDSDTSGWRPSAGGVVAQMLQGYWHKAYQSGDLTGHPSRPTLRRRSVRAIRAEISRSFAINAINFAQEMRRYGFVDAEGDVDVLLQVLYQVPNLDHDGHRIGPVIIGTPLSVARTNRSDH
jgi:hypothetical protein